ARWEFLHDGDAWIWRVFRIDGSIENMSEPMAVFGKALIDAVRHGFRPQQTHWTISDKGGVTHFAPGAAPVTSTPCGDVLLVRRNEVAPEMALENRKSKPPVL